MRAQRRLRRRSRAELMAVGLTGFALASGAGIAKDPEARAAQPKPDTAAKVISVLKQRIVSHQPVALDAGHDTIWGRPDRPYELRTEAALTAFYDGHKHFFQLVQTGRGLAGIEPREIPKPLFRIPSLPTYDPLPGDVHHRRDIVTDEAVIKLQPSGVAMANVRFEDGQHELIPAGETTPYAYDQPVAIISPR